MPKKILIVDDEESILALFLSVLKPPSYLAIEALSGEIALRLAQDHVFDLAFIDIVMPGISGIETSKRLRRMQPNLKIVLMTGYLTENAPEVVNAAGAEAFLQKSFSPLAITALTEKLLASSTS